MQRWWIADSQGVRCAGAAIALALTCAGCTSPNTYATARTLSPGDITSTVAVEGIAYNGSQGAGVLPVLPTYVFRVGVVDHVDVGARIGSLTELGADVKINFLRGPIDLAIAGGGEAFLEWHYESHGDAPPLHRTGSRAWLHLPFIAAYNFSRKFSLVATPGVAYVVGRKVDSHFVRTQPFDGDTVAGRLGLGLDYRWKENRAIHPEVTLIQSLSSSAAIVMFGVGFNLGDLPKYDDIDGEPHEELRPAPPHDPPSTPAPSTPAPSTQAPPSAPTTTTAPSPSPPAPAPAPAPTPATPGGQSIF